MSRISIITPTFQSGDFVEACVENVAAQGVVGLEHIVVDNASTDGTVALLEGLQRKHAHLRFVSERDGGQSDALNKGVRLASAPVLGVLNVDDYYEAGAVSRALAFLDAHPSVAMVVGDCRVLGPEDALMYWNRPKDLRLESLVLGWGYAPFPCNPSAYFYRTEVHDEVGPYDVADPIAMDLSFLLQCASSLALRHVDEHWGNFRLRPGTKTFEAGDAGAARVEAIFAAFRARLSLRRKVLMRGIKAQKDMERAWLTWTSRRERAHAAAASPG